MARCKKCGALFIPPLKLNPYTKLPLRVEYCKICEKKLIDIFTLLCIVCEVSFPAFCIY